MKKLFALLLFIFCTVPLMAKEKPVLKIVITTDIHAHWDVLDNVYAFMAKKNPGLHGASRACIRFYLPSFI